MNVSTSTYAPIHATAIAQRQNAEPSGIEVVAYDLLYKAQASFDVCVGSFPAVERRLNLSSARVTLKMLIRRLKG